MNRVATRDANGAVIASVIASVILPAALLAADGAWAQAPKYPTKPIRLLVTLGPGSAGDNLSRLMADGLSRSLGQQVVVDNRPGAGGNVAAELAARAAPDGYTLFITTISTHGINPTLYGKLAFDPIKDFAPIILAASSPNMLVVHPSLPVRTVKDFIALARQKPGELTYSSGGTGTSQHMAGELFGMLTGTRLTHIAYKSTPLSVNAVLSGETIASFASVSVVSGIVQAGKLRTLGVTNAKRIPSLPDLPTIAESGVPGFAIAAWFGFSATGGTPEPIVNLLNAEMRKVLQDPGNRQKLAAQGMDVLDSTPAEFAAYIRSEIDLWGKVVKASGAKAQ
ncbi:MAG: tripartite tricarboxylate transporter substrate binding protein [Proteobacteria bacterium]|nr:tripartite tricarboxylate transporter substrate binding protein [Pseudomonadota bacterium]